MEFEVSKIFSGECLERSQDALSDLVSSFYLIDETDYIKQLYPYAYDDEERQLVRETTAKVIDQSRSVENKAFFDLEALLQEYSLNDEDGVTLMCLAEALLRIPDDATRDALISDKIGEKEWSKHLNKDNSLFVNASTWGLMVAGKLINVDDNSTARFFKNSTKPVIRKSVDRAMRIMGKHFVLGRTIKEAMKNASPYIKKGYVYSYDMLGESAITRGEAGRYLDSYSTAIETIAKYSKDKNNRPSLSIKLSALHPRFEEVNREVVLKELSASVIQLVEKGIEFGVGVTIDAEEADRLELTLSLFETVYKLPLVRGWGKFGLVIQAYSKRALPALCWLAKISKTYGDEIPLRLVKGAYWDSEIQHSQVLGLSDYPVFTHKEYTDTAYLACARFLLSDVTRGLIYPQFASHNAQTVSSVKVMAPKGRAFEFQRLHGMGDDLYDSLLEIDSSASVRIYAPVGSHEDLLPYLVRRLLENGANSSFVHQISDTRVMIDDLVRRPLEFSDIDVKASQVGISKPSEIYKNRLNSEGQNVASKLSQKDLLDAISEFENKEWVASSILNGDEVSSGDAIPVYSPYDTSKVVGKKYFATNEMAKQALSNAAEGFEEWTATDVETRAQILEKMADLMEANKYELMSLAQREAGKVLEDAINEIREAVDFCRYYAVQARKSFINPIELDGPTGESNELSFEGRGVFVCISPWNYPLAIFMGQISAALVAGNTVIAKPAESTSLIAMRAAELFFEAGLPSNALQLLPGSGAELGAVLNSDERVSGVVFTGSNQTAQRINITLANRSLNAGIATLVAETGGLNAMLVDSTALPEQVAMDVVNSAFSAAGQRCSALRVVYLQADIADRVIELIKGAMNELTIGDPNLLSTDIGPVIDSTAQINLLNYIGESQKSSLDFYQVELSEECQKGLFVPPTLLEIDSIQSMDEEQFGPILHVVKYETKDLDNVISDINKKRYGLTMGIHSRNTSLFERIAKKARIGNIYINRNQIGAVVGVNPFGGCGLSGTGPKAGGPHYLLRFATEKTITINTAAIGGNVDLLNFANS